MQCKDNFANSVQTPVLLSWRIKSVWKFAISESGNIEAPTLKVQVDRRIPIQITQRTLDIDSRGNDLRKGRHVVTLKVREVQKNQKKLLRVTLATE